MATFNKSKRKEIYDLHNGRCFHCNRFLNTGGDDFNRDPAWFVVDHLVPISLGGDNSNHNLVACCRSCNSKKKNKYPWIYNRERIGT